MFTGNILKPTPPKHRHDTHKACTSTPMSYHAIRSNLSANSCPALLSPTSGMQRSPPPSFPPRIPPWCQPCGKKDCPISKAARCTRQTVLSCNALPYTYFTLLPCRFILASGAPVKFCRKPIETQRIRQGRRSRSYTLAVSMVDQ